MMRTLHRNPRLLAGYHALHMMLFPISIMTLFWKHSIGMSMTEILLLQGFFGLVMAVFEFPSGYISDRIGYRKTLMISAALATVGWGVYAMADSIVVVVIAEAVLGVSVSMVSGSDSALLYESLRATDREDEFSKWNGRVRFWGQTGEGSAALVAGGMYVFWPPLPFIVQAVVSCGNLVIAYLTVEPERQSPPRGEHWQQIRSMIRFALVDNRHLTALFMLAIVLGLSSFIPVWLIPLYATGAGVPEAWIGPIWAVANYTVAFGALASTRVSRWLGLVPTLAGCVLLVAIGYAGLGLSYGLFGFAWYGCLTMMRGIFGPLVLHQENRLIPSSDRAGFLSMRSLLFRLSFLAVAPVIGVVVDSRGQHTALLGIGMVLTVLATAALIWLRHHHRQSGAGSN